MGIRFILKEYTWLVILVAVVIGFVYPGFGYVFKPYVGYLLMSLMFLGSINIDFARSWKHLKKVRKIFWSLLVIHVLSALLIYLLRDRFSPDIFLGLIIASAAPAGISVIFLSHLYGGSVDKSLVISFLSNVLSPVLLPLVVFVLAGQVIRVDWLNMAWTIVKLVVLPVALALLARRTWLAGWLKAEGTYISVLVLFFLVSGVIAPVSQMLLADINQSIYLALFILVMIGINFGLGYLLGSDHKAKVTYAISMSYKNFTLAMVIALTLFGPTVALPAAIYTVINNLFLIPLQLVLARARNNVVNSKSIV